MGLLDRIWATRLGFGSLDWDSGLETGGGRHYGMWLVIASGMTIFFVLKTDLNLKETLAKNILAYVSVDFSIK